MAKNHFEKFRKEIGAKIKEVRNKKKSQAEKGLFTQEFMDDGSDFGIDIKYYQAIERGEKNFTLQTLYKICMKLEIEPNEIFQGIQVSRKGK